MITLRNERWLVKVIKRKPLPDGTPDQFTGTTHNDGLQSLWTVHVLETNPPQIRYASVLDTVHWISRMRETLAEMPRPQ